ncbi:hypothetical protein J5U22_01584 [Saccharolobus shibatae]|nr:hypothetical protein J5U22_01584 [Saccharolobus shibatae]
MRKISFDSKNFFPRKYVKTISIMFFILLLSVESMIGGFSVQHVNALASSSANSSIL